MTTTHHWTPSLGRDGFAVYAVDPRKKSMELVCIALDQALANRVVAALDAQAAD